LVTAIVETSVIVDLLRNHPPAITWYQAQTQPTLGITPIIWMEVLSGGLNKAERLRSARLLQQFSMLYLNEADLNWAMQAQMQYELSPRICLGCNPYLFWRWWSNCYPEWSIRLFAWVKKPAVRKRHKYQNSA